MNKKFAIHELGVIFGMLTDIKWQSEIAERSLYEELLNSTDNINMIWKRATWSAIDD